MRSDSDGEYTSGNSKSLRQNVEFGMNSVSKTPAQDGVAETLNRVLIEKVRTMLVQSRLLHSFWAEALNTAVHVHNLSPS